MLAPAQEGKRGSGLAGHHPPPTPPKRLGFWEAFSPEKLGDSTSCPGHVATASCTLPSLKSPRLSLPLRPPFLLWFAQRCSQRRFAVGKAHASAGLDWDAAGEQTLRGTRPHDPAGPWCQRVAGLEAPSSSACPSSCREWDLALLGAPLPAPSRGTSWAHSRVFQPCLSPAGHHLVASGIGIEGGTPRSPRLAPCSPPRASPPNAAPLLATNPKSRPRGWGTRQRRPLGLWEHFGGKYLFFATRLSTGTFLAAFPAPAATTPWGWAAGERCAAQMSAGSLARSPSPWLCFGGHCLPVPSFAPPLSPPG